MKKKYKLLYVLLFGFIFFFIVDHIPVKGDTNYQDIDLTNINNLMIVAHPDDEILWGGGHLIEDNYLVVCITCGRSRIRVREFQQIMKDTNDRYIMLDYPDSFLGIRSKWSNLQASLSNDLKEILNLKEWDLVVTHNPDGEYGHIQHKITSNLVTNLYHGDNLYYFGHYYSKKDIASISKSLSPLRNDLYQQKINLLKKYHSQYMPKKKHQQMNKYENWIKVDEWC